jgi:hypothetical protein
MRTAGIIFFSLVSQSVCPLGMDAEALAVFQDFLHIAIPNVSLSTQKGPPPKERPVLLVSYDTVFS